MGWAGEAPTFRLATEQQGQAAMSTVLSEDQVVEAVRDHLLDHGWEIISRATATEHGDDLEAERFGQRLVVEAKGAGSSKAGTAPYGRAFSKNQVNDHVAKATLKALRAVSAGAIGGIALPDNPDHRAEVERVWPALDALDVVVFWVSDEGAVEVQA